MSERKKDFMELIDERHELLDEVKRFVDAGPSEYGQKKIIELLKTNESRRRELLKLLKNTPIRDLDGDLREYYETLIDYIQMIDSEREEEIISKVVDYAEKNPGALKDNIEWLRKQVREAKDYREETSRIMRE